MKKIFKKGISILIAGLTSLVILSLFCLVYNYTGIHISNPSGSTDYKWDGCQLKTTMVEGFAWLKMDEFGFNNAFSRNCKHPDLLLMGSSHMEALEVGMQENVGFFLNNELAPLTTYNIGTSGHDIYRCANNIRNAVLEYNPSKYVVVETDTVSLTVPEIDAVINGKLDKLESYDRLFWKHCVYIWIFLI